jgi:glutaredoxin-like protein NrdH
MAITVYSKPACVQCNSTYRKLDKHGVVYNTVDVSKDAEAFDFVQSLGYAQVPVVVTDDDHWSGFKPDMIEALVQPKEETAA